MFHVFPVDKRYVYSLFSLAKLAKFALVMGIVMTVSGRASSSFKKDVSYLFCTKTIVIIQYDMFYML